MSERTGTPPFEVANTTTGYGAGEVRVTSSTGGSKGKKLAQFSLIPTGPLRRVAEHYGKGGDKYGDPRNWERGYDWSLSYDALCRHLTAWWGGEDLDPDFTNGASEHLAAVAFHALALMEWRDTHPEFDDRPSSKPVVEAINTLTASAIAASLGGEFTYTNPQPPKWWTELDERTPLGRPSRYEELGEGVFR